MLLCVQLLLWLLDLVLEDGRTNAFVCFGLVLLVLCLAIFAAFLYGRVLLASDEGGGSRSYLCLV